MGHKMIRTVIAGGTSGIGFAIAKLSSAKNWQTTILGRNQEKLNDALWELNGTSKGMSADATDMNAVKKVMPEIGNFDHLVVALSGNKGIGMFKDLDLAQLRQGFDEKFFAQLNIVQSALPYINSGGSITLITAVSSQAKGTGTSGLGAINGALEIMVPVLAKELKPVRVNAVSPGVINTAWWDFLPADKKQETFQHWAGQTAAGRIGEPEDVANAVLSIIENTYITGQVIAVDGGLCLGG